MKKEEFIEALLEETGFELEGSVEDIKVLSKEEAISSNSEEVYDFEDTDSRIGGATFSASASGVSHNFVLVLEDLGDDGIGGAIIDTTDNGFSKELSLAIYLDETDEYSTVVKEFVK